MVSRFIIHYSEVSLKGKNRWFFVNKLLTNLACAAKARNVEILDAGGDEKRILVSLATDEKTGCAVLADVLGIKYYAPITELALDINAVVVWAKARMSVWAQAGIKTIAFKSKRLNKSFSLTSPEFNAVLGQVASDCGLKVDYDGAEHRLYFEIGFKEIIAYSQKIPTWGGLPVGSAGRVLCLLSGGIDSPVAAWLMMKRGCRVDFLHIASGATAVLPEKISQLLACLNRYQYGSKVFVLPATNYNLATMGKVSVEYELLMFKHYLLAMAEHLARINGYKAVVVGDNLAQVASQTLENLGSVSQNIKTLVCRPVLTYDKEEIINLATKIGTYAISNQPYRDCCSFYAGHPLTKSKVPDFVAQAQLIPWEKLLNDSMAGTKAYLCRPGQEDKMLV